MATRYYTGAAPLAFQVTTVTPGGTIAATDTFSVTIGGTTFTFTATTTTVAHVVTGLYNLIVASQTASSSAEWLRVTATDSVTTLTLTANAAGEPFTVSTAIVNTSGGAAPTLTAATTTANSGPEQYDLATNWSGGAIPANGDTVVVEGNFNLRYGTLTGVTAARLIVRDFSGEIGLPPINVIGGYQEYRSQYFIMSATLADVMQNVSSPLLRFNVETVQTLFSVYTTGVSQGDLIKAFTFIGTHASNVLNVLDGSCGVATEAGEAATLASFTIAGGELELGLGCTLGAGIQDGGDFVLYSDMSGALTINSGSCTLIDDPDITGATKVYANATLTVNGGPTFTAAISLFGGTLDLSKDTRTITTTGGVTVYPGSRINDPFGRLGTCTITMAGGADTDGPQQAFLRLGPNKVHAVS